MGHFRSGGEQLTNRSTRKQFREDLLRKGAIGGAEAAYYLSGHIQKHIRRYNGADDWKIVVRVYIDLDSLLQSFAPTGLIDERDLLRHFSRGFAQHQPLFDIVDVGNVQNQVEVKIRGTFHSIFDTSFT